MANVVSGLFGLSPEQVIQQQQATDTAEAANLGALMPEGYGAVGYGMSKLGSGAIRGLSSVFGLEDPSLTKAKDMEQIMRDTQDELGSDATPDELYQGLYNRLMDKGYGSEAVFALEARQQYLDNQETLDLKRKELEATISSNNATMINKMQETVRKQAKELVDKQQTDLNWARDSYDDVESDLYTSGMAWAENLDSAGLLSFAPDDPEVVFSALKGLHQELISMNQIDQFGNVIPMLDQNQALRYAKEILSTTDKDGNLKYIDKGNWNPFKGTTVKLDGNTKQILGEKIAKDLGLQYSDKSKSLDLSMITDQKDIDAFNAAQADPENPYAARTLQILNDKYNK